MSHPLETAIETAIEAIKAGDREAGKRLLVRVIQQDPRNEMAWLWMTRVVDSNEERVKCLQYVLEINPNNEAARRGLLSLQGEHPQQEPPPPDATVPPETGDRVTPPSPPLSWVIVGALLLGIVSGCMGGGIGTLWA